MVLVLQGVHLLRGQTGVGEHAVLMTRLVCYHGYMLCLELTYLVNDVLPCTRGLQTNKLVIESLAHALDARAHFLQVLVPLGCKLVAGEDLLDDAAAGSGAHGELATDEMAEVVHDNVTDTGGAAVGAVVERTDTLTV